MDQLYLRNVATLMLDEDKCAGCGMCTAVCPHRVFELPGKKARIRNRDGCMECGACSRNCPFGAITVDAGVGCAVALIKGALTGREASCGCSSSGNCC